MPKQSQHKWHLVLQMATITAGQCRAARALLAWSQRDLEVRAKVSRKAIADFEREASTPYPRTLRDIVETLEAAGIVFQPPQEGIIGAGVALKWGIEPKIGLGNNENASGQENGGMSGASWDDDFFLDEAALSNEDREWLEYIRKNPDLSANGRRILIRDAYERFSIKQVESNDGLAR